MKIDKKYVLNAKAYAEMFQKNNNKIEFIERR